MREHDRLGPYAVSEPLGAGGMGEVWRAEDTRIGREVALKLLPDSVAEDPERHARFEREAKLLASLNHPNIATLYGLEHLDGKHVLVMELVDGEGIDDVIARGPVPADEAVAVALQIAEALEAAHEAGIVHRDLKPANVRRRPDGTVKVLDFGLAKAWAEDAEGADLSFSPTITGHAAATDILLGTAGYMAPEQARGRRVDRRADIWAFGVVLWELLTGGRLFDGETVTDVLAAVLTREPDLAALPADVPRELRRLVERCLTRDPRQRLRDIGEARVALERLSRGETEAAAVPAAPHRRPRAAAAGWVTAVVMALALAGVWLAHGRNRLPPRVIRATLPLPTGVAIELDGERTGMPALSPDGRRIAFGAREGAGPTRIWVYDLAAAAPHPLAGTEGGYRPFWSPDGRTLGFFTWGHLSTIPADGGSVTRLAPSRDGRGGTWNRRGTILYTPYASGPICSVPAGGGPSTEVTGTAASVGIGTHRFPQFLPDGEHFLFLDRPAPFGAAPQTAVVVGRLGSNERHRVLELATNAVYSQHHLLYVRDGALVAQPFDPGTFELGGPPRPLVTDLLVNQRFSYGVFSAGQAGIVSFMTGRQSDLSQLVWRDPSDRRLGELGTPGVLTGYGGLAISADGRWAAVSRVDPGAGDADLWLYDLARGAETRLARAGTDESDPIFAADSGTLYFATSNDRKASTIVAHPLAGGEERILAAADESTNLAPTSVSPDGRWLVYDRRRLSTIADVMLLPLDGDGKPRALVATEGDDGFAQISPDGRWLAWSSDRSGRYETYVASFPDVGAAVQVSRDGGTQPRWSPSGRELYFKAPDNTITAVPVETASGTFAVGAPRRLFPVVEFFGWTYAPAPDGNRFLVREPLTEGEVSPITLLTDWTALLEAR